MYKYFIVGLYTTFSQYILTTTYAIWYNKSQGHAHKDMKTIEQILDNDDFNTKKELVSKKAIELSNLIGKKVFELTDNDIRANSSEIIIKCNTCDDFVIKADYRPIHKNNEYIRQYYVSIQSVSSSNKTFIIDTNRDTPHFVYIIFLNHFQKIIKALADREKELAKECEDALKDVACVTIE